MSIKMNYHSIANELANITITIIQESVITHQSFDDGH